jgi:DNA-binding protein YbaB
MLEDLILAAVNDATRRIEEAVASKMSGLRIPGF